MTNFRTITIQDLCKKHPFLKQFFALHQLPLTGSEQQTIPQFLASLDPQFFSEHALNPELLQQHIESYLTTITQGAQLPQVRSLTILPGQNKRGSKERFGTLTIRQGEVITIVGPTGSGKSRLLADIEWIAQGDTPTKRRILINDLTPDTTWRFSATQRLVAQLSQNMNFVMDLSVQDFLQLHAESRLLREPVRLAKKVLKKSNELAGESFTGETPVTALSGGQSRALMIADAAYISSSPIVLIDEIENAGVDRKKALELLLGQDKIVIMATHDPLLALLADKRIVIRQGGIHEVLTTTPTERTLRTKLTALDAKLQKIRHHLRQGRRLTATL